MERDFLGLRNEDLRASGQDGAFLGSAVQWPFSNKNTAMQQYMSYKAAQEERQKMFGIEQFSSSGFQPMSTVDVFETSQRTSASVSSQKYDRQVIHQFPMQPYQSQGVETLVNSNHQLKENRTFPVMSHHSVPVTASSPFFQVHGNNPNIKASSLNQPPYGINMSASGAGSACGTFPPRNLPKRTPMSAQLTIFYAGTVNVYDDVPFEKAQAIMMLASKGSNTGCNATKPRSEVPLQASGPIPTVPTHVSNPILQTTISAPMFQTTVQSPILQATVPVMTKPAATNGLNSKVSIPAPIRVPSPCSVVSSPISVASRLGANSGTVSSTIDDTARPKLAAPMTSGSPQEVSKNSSSGSGSTTPADAVPRAVPQARKASLARFLEKRKERITNVMPYSCNMKNVDSGVQFDSTNAMRISSSINVSVPSIRLDLQCLGKSNASIISGEPPSTRLEM